MAIEVGGLDLIHLQSLSFLYCAFIYFAFLRGLLASLVWR